MSGEASPSVTKVASKYHAVPGGFVLTLAVWKHALEQFMAGTVTKCFIIRAVHF